MGDKFSCGNQNLTFEPPLNTIGSLIATAEIIVKPVTPVIAVVSVDVTTLNVTAPIVPNGANAAPNAPPADSCTVKAAVVTRSSLSCSELDRD